MKYDIVRIINKIKSFWYLSQTVANIYKENDNKCSLLFATEPNAQTLFITHRFSYKSTRIIAFQTLEYLIQLIIPT